MTVEERLSNLECHCGISLEEKPAEKPEDVKLVELIELVFYKVYVGGKHKGNIYTKEGGDEYEADVELINRLSAYADRPAGCSWHDLRGSLDFWRGVCLTAFGGGHKG